MIKKINVNFYRCYKMVGIRGPSVYFHKILQYHPTFCVTKQLLTG